jgi:[ribosomal protein S18]-alanine N-acetyltransferase
MTETLRPMRWWDVASAAALDRELFEDPWTEAGFWSELAGVPDSRYYVVAEEDGQLVGYAGLFAVPPEADVQTVAVVAGRQGAGLGRRLLADLLAQARRRGCSQVLLEVRDTNAAARALYASMGFEQVAVRRGYYGPRADAVVMRLRLRDRPDEARGGPGARV